MLFSSTTKFVSKKRVFVAPVLYLTPVRYMPGGMKPPTPEQIKAILSAINNIAGTTATGITLSQAYSKIQEDRKKALEERESKGREDLSAHLRGEEHKDHLLGRGRYYTDEPPSPPSDKPGGFTSSTIEFEDLEDIGLWDYVININLPAYWWATVLLVIIGPLIFKIAQLITVNNMLKASAENNTVEQLHKMQLELSCQIKELVVNCIIGQISAVVIVTTLHYLDVIGYSAGPLEPVLLFTVTVIAGIKAASAIKVRWIRRGAQDL